MTSCILTHYSWCKTTTLSNSQRVILTSMKCRLVAIWNVVEKKGHKKSIFANKNIMTSIYFLGFWQKSKFDLIKITVGAIDSALNGFWPINRNEFSRAVQYLEELGLYVWKVETAHRINEADSKHLLSMLNLVSK
ncbi:MAG: hypothetical protein NTX26_00755 [Candidatus Parcubacteria bacterium]|nr:hypothetical protein [Candidatus Parcubacteria bacterium]